MKKIIFFLLAALLLATPTLPLPQVSGLAANDNLIANPSVESEISGQPQQWNTNSWGSNSPVFSYQTAGHTGNRGLAVTISNYQDGDAKWLAEQTNVAAGQTYTYTDYSKSDVTTELDAAFVDNTGKMSFVYLKSVPKSDTWQQTSVKFAVPNNAVSVSIYHIIYSNGHLQTDDFSLTLDQPTTPGDPTTPSPANLLPNASFEESDGDNPVSWQRGGWGDNNAVLTYLTGSAHTGERSVQIKMTNVNNGDAKWYTSPMLVEPGSKYVYQDYYKADVTSRVVAALIKTDGNEYYIELNSAPATTTWARYNTTFTTPSDVQNVTIYHLIDQVGVLDIDDVSLAEDSTTTPPEPTEQNVVPNPSFETNIGNAPASWQADSWGDNDATFTYIQDDAHSGTKSTKVEIADYASGDAKWSFTPLNNLVAGSQYTLSAWYKTNIQPRVVVTYVDKTGDNQYLTMPSPLANPDSASSWQQYSTVVDIPTDATGLSVYFLIAGNGWLQTDDFSMAPHSAVGFNAPIISLTFDDGWSSIYAKGLPALNKYGFVSTQYLISSRLNTTGYMTTAMARAFQKAGHELASHTVTHPDLTQLTTDQLISELGGSQDSLRQLLGNDTAYNLALPYGLYNANVLSYIKQYYRSSRSTDVGFNTKDNFNPYNILVQNIQTNTTPAQVATWVAKAKREKSWLVLVYHAVSNSTNPNDYAVSPQNLNKELSNIKASGIAVKTVDQALAAIQQQL